VLWSSIYSFLHILNYLFTISTSFCHMRWMLCTIIIIYDLLLKAWPTYRLLFEVNFTRGVKCIILALLYILLQLDVMQLLAILAILQSILNLFQGLFYLMASVKNLHVVAYVDRTDWTGTIHYFDELWVEGARFDFRHARASFLLHHVQTDSSWLLFCSPVIGDISCPVVPRLRKGGLYSYPHLRLHSLVHF